MSEKKSNGQVPEEGPDGKNLEQSEETAHPDCNMRTGFRRLCMPGILCVASACTEVVSRKDTSCDNSGGRSVRGRFSRR